MLFRNKLLLAADVNKTTNRDYKLHAGAEYCFAGIVCLRAGINETEFSCGVGFKYKNYAIDYAFALNDAVDGSNSLGPSNRVGITVRFGKPVLIDYND